VPALEGWSLPVTLHRHVREGKNHMYEVALKSASAILAAVAAGECSADAAVTRATEILARPSTTGRKAKRWNDVIATVTGAVAPTPAVVVAAVSVGVPAAVAAAQAQLDAAKAAYVTAQAIANAPAPSAEAARESAVAKLVSGKFMSAAERAALLAYVTR